MNIPEDDRNDLFLTAETIFREYYDDILWLENRRRNMLFVFITTSILIFLLVAFAAPLFISFYQQAHYEHDLALMIFGHRLIIGMIFVILLAPLQYVILDDAYRQLAKRKCLPILANCLKMTYRRGGYFMLTTVYDHHIIPPYTTRTVEEGFAGKFKGFRIEFQDFSLSPVRHYLCPRDYYGLVLKTELNKTFHHHTVLLPAKEQRKFLSLLPNPNLFLHQDINLVYRSFTRHYVCLSTDQVEARYVMDPAVMGRFTNLAETFDTDRISASFMDGEMVAMLRPGKNLFEIGTLRDPVTVLTIERTLRQINALRHMAEIFELNDKSGLGARVPDTPKDLH